MSVLTVSRAVDLKQSIKPKARFLWQRGRELENQSGFTMVELIVVIIIVGIMAAVALPNMSLMFGYDETGYRDKVKAAVEYARRSAVAQRRIACVTVSGSQVSLRIELTTPETVGSGTCATAGLVSSQDLNLPTADTHCSGGVRNMICPPNAVSLPDASLSFDALGRPLDGAGAVLTATTTWTVTNGKTGDAVSLNVAAESGYVY